MTHKHLVAALVTALLTGCALYDDPPPYVEATPEPPDMSEAPDLATPDLDMPDADMPDSGPTCTPRACMPGQCGMQDNGCGVQISCGSPLTACPADTCGMIPDGCGGTLDCGACKCVGGQPTTSRCGTCELGLLRCEDDTPVCEDIPLPPGVQLPCDSIIYVDSEASAAGGIGTRTQPLSSLDAGIKAAQQASKRLVLIAGDGRSVEPIVMADGVHVIAGFAPGSYARNPALRPRHQIPAGTGDVFGVTANGIVQPTVLSGLDITTADATGHSATNYGVYASNSPGLTLHNLTVQAGRGGPGRDGAAGMRGANGGVGGLGQIGRQQQDQDPILNMYPQSGAAGVNAACPAANGGRGGGGYGYDTVEMTDEFGIYLQDLPPQQGFASPAGTQGGAAGTGTAGSRNGKGGQSSLTSNMIAMAGRGGTSGGEIEMGLWRPLGVGERGATGAHGAGGGGGGGAWSCGVNEQPIAERCSSVFGGPGGGGGGAGGCGGEGGLGGDGGGGSFGLFVSASPMILVKDSAFTADLGGAGGRGGQGGDQGTGGNGGQGSNLATTFRSDPQLGTIITVEQIVRQGGAGGRGANGRPGASGGGGAGGVSYGAYCVGGQLRAEGLVTFTAGGAASGGTTSDGMPSGQVGTSLNELQCR